MSDKMYISTSMTIMASDRSMIAPGVPFEGSKLVKATLKSAISNGTIQEIDINKSLPVVKKPTIGKTYTGPKEGVKDTAINPTKIGLIRKPPETITPELLAEKEVIRKALLVFDISMPSNCRLDTLKKRLTNARAAAPEAVLGGNKSPSKTIPVAVWDADPEEIKDTPMDILLPVYRTRCEAFAQDLEEFDTIELLREKMSSQYVPTQTNE